MTEKEARRYLDYLGDEAEHSPNDMRASHSQRESISKTGAVLVTLVLVGLMFGLMYYGVKQTIPGVVQTTRNVTGNIPITAPSLATLASRDNTQEVWGVIISIGIYTTPAMPEGTSG
jgi:hypothetical protein